MENHVANSNIVTSPQQAVEEFVGEQFIQWALNFINHEMRNWPIIMKINQVKTKPEKVKKFMLQRFLAQEAFLGMREGDPGFLRFAIANLSESDDPTAEAALEILEKKRQEALLVTPRRELWVKLLKALGVTDEELQRSEPKEVTRNYIAELSDVYSNSPWQTAVGAFAAYEWSEPEEFQVIFNMIKANTNLAENDLEVLSLHIGADVSFVVEAGHILDKVVFDKDTKALVWEGIARELEIRKQFLNEAYKYLES